MSFNLSDLIREKIPDIERVRDDQWVRNSFMVSGEEVDEAFRQKRYFSSADIKITDSSLGGSFACNSKTQFTRYADNRRMGRRKNVLKPTSIYNSEFNLGMGQFYSEHFDDQAQLLFLEFGVAKFSSLFNFFASAVDQPTSNMAKHASGDSFYRAGKAIGFAVGVLIRKMYAVVALVVYGIKSIYGLVVGNTHAKYYWLKPAMHVYWNTVNNLVSATAMEIGLVHPHLEQPRAGAVGAPVAVSAEERTRVNNVFGDEVFGDIISESGQIDVRAIINRANRTVAEQVRISRMMDGKKQVSMSEWEDYLYGTVTTPARQPIELFINDVMSGKTLYRKPKPGDKDSEPALVEKESLFRMMADGSFGDAMYDKLLKEQSDIDSYMESAMTGGARYAVFETQYLGSQTTSFTNRIKDIPTEGAMNSMGGATRDLAFSTAGANFIGAGMAEIVKATTDLAEGVLSSVTFGASNILIALLGGGFVEMPKMWEDSEMTAQEYTFKIRLSSPYNHPMAALQKKFIPMHMILAGALPLATGKATYVSPFLCNAYMRGMVDIDLGMITKASITSDVGNVGRDTTGRSLAYDMEFTITDFSTMLSAPVSSMAFGSIVNSIDETSSMGRFLSRLGARDIFTTKFMLRRAGLRLVRLQGDFERATDPAYLASLIGDSIIPFTGLFMEDVNLINISGN